MEFEKKENGERLLHFNLIDAINHNHSTIAQIHQF